MLQSNAVCSLQTRFSVISIELTSQVATDKELWVVMKAFREQLVRLKDTKLIILLSNRNTKSKFHGILCSNTTTLEYTDSHTWKADSVEVQTR